MGMPSSSFMDAGSGGEGAATSSATAISRAGDGAMSFGGGKNQLVLILTVAAVLAATVFILKRPKRKK